MDVAGEAQTLAAALNQLVIGTGCDKTSSCDPVPKVCSGPRLWSAPPRYTPVPACAATATMCIGEFENTACSEYLVTSEHAKMRWQLEHCFLAFEKLQ